MTELIRIQDILQKVQAYHPRADVDLIQKAYVFAAQVHDGQTRNSGEPYLMHPMAVADVVADLKLDEASLCAAILHDTVEDTEATLDQLGELFGDRIAGLVDGLTKLAKIRFHSAEQRQAENFRKMIVAMSRDLRVILVKLADRLHNMRTLAHMTRDKQTRIARETIDIYAPLANRLGINAIKQELEDLSFRYLWPDDYKSLAEKVAATRKQRQSYIRSVIDEINKLLKSYDLEAEVSGRPKHLYSIWRKMRQQGIDFEHVYDLLGFRIITDTEKDCYHALGLIHMSWRPIPGRFKDYLALPKPNNYRSLHTAVIGPAGHRIEVQIRTEEMQYVAEYGVAAHWRYKEGGQAPDQDDLKFNWLKQLMEWQRELKDPDDFLDTLKLDLFSEDVYVFTPRGDLRVMPRGSTPVDFAYAIHSEVGDHCAGALVNGRIMPLSSELKNGDMVEILTRDHQRPNSDWLRFVRTGRARHKIRAFKRKAERAAASDLGRELLGREIKRYGTSLQKASRQGWVNDALRNLGAKDQDDLFVRVGLQRIQLSNAIRQILPPEVRERRREKEEPDEESPESLVSRVAESLRKTFRGHRSGIKVDGLDDLLVRTARCCQPVPGEPIVGFVTLGRGVSIHAKDCANLQASDPERRVEAYWDSRGAGPQATWIRVTCHNTEGKLAEMSAIFSVRKINILNANCQSRDDQTAVNDFEVVVSNAGQLESAMTALRGLAGVIAVERLRTS